MALDQSALTELLDALRSGGDLDFMREAMQLVLQALIDLEATEKIGAGRYKRSDIRTTHRNGSRSRLLSTKAGDVELTIPKLRHGSFFPALLEPRRRIDRALWAVIMEAFVHGVSTRKVDDLVAALGIDAGVSKSQLSRICAELDASVAEFRQRRLDHAEFPYVFVDATEGPRRRPGGVQGHHRGHRGERRRQPGGAGRRRRRQRGQGVLDGVPALAAGPGAGRGAPGHLRCPRRSSFLHRAGDARRIVATVVSAPSTTTVLHRRSITDWREGPAGHSPPAGEGLGSVTFEVWRQTFPSRRWRAQHWPLGVALRAP